MALSSLRNWMADILGILYLWVNGVEQPQSTGLEFLGSAVTSAYDPVTNRNKITITSATTSLHETGGPTDLTIGAIADGEILRRIGSTIVGQVLGRMLVQDGTDADTTCLANRVVFVPTTTTQRTYSLPAAPINGDFVTIRTTNPEDFSVIVSGNGQNINNGFDTPTTTYLISQPGASIHFVYHAASTTWRII